MCRSPVLALIHRNEPARDIRTCLFCITANSCMALYRRSRKRVKNAQAATC
ncbi:hypothetical protein VFPPC_16801 [Pochonia chlamydosporia 170]|uniref:Uncharacterized protein n=1 Tax=Pochonia chlamydosporia 170 TaxID=1380566 RepID=A0A179F3P9_METCM|nr:hypothetical protein VFPPC_16801 [Pochonia chlamydosporia 170]OAQ59813.1 hypothetical protein VFPPC_16801 [Pochonia chlamydosporia 170]